jgi:hypothetical protein
MERPETNSFVVGSFSIRHIKEVSKYKSVKFLKIVLAFSWRLLYSIGCIIMVH